MSDKSGKGRKVIVVIDQLLIGEHRAIMCCAAEWRGGGGALARCVRVGSRARGSPETHRQHVVATFGSIAISPQVEVGESHYACHVYISPENIKCVRSSVRNVESGCVQRSALTGVVLFTIPPHLALSYPKLPQLPDAEPFHHL